MERDKRRDKIGTRHTGNAHEMDCPSGTLPWDDTTLTTLRLRSRCGLSGPAQSDKWDTGTKLENDDELPRRFKHARTRTTVRGAVYSLRGLFRLQRSEH